MLIGSVLRCNERVDIFTHSDLDVISTENVVPNGRLESSIRVERYRRTKSKSQHGMLLPTPSPSPSYSPHPLTFINHIEISQILSIPPHDRIDMTLQHALQRGRIRNVCDVGGSLRIPTKVVSTNDGTCSFGFGDDL